VTITSPIVVEPRLAVGTTYWASVGVAARAVDASKKAQGP
jgi:hypothetical protein